MIHENEVSLKGKYVVLGDRFTYAHFCLPKRIPGFGRETVTVAAHLNLGWMQEYPGRRLQSVFEGLHPVRHWRGCVLGKEHQGCIEETELQ